MHRRDLLGVELRQGDLLWVSVEEGWKTVRRIDKAPAGALWDRIAVFTDGTTLNLVTGILYHVERLG